MDETYIKVKGLWKYLYRGVDRDGKTVDFLLTAKRDMSAAKRFFDKAIAANGKPDKITMDKSGANKAAIDAINAYRDVTIVVRHVKYLNNIGEQGHRVIQRVTRPILNPKSFHNARSVPFRSRRRRVHTHDSQGPVRRRRRAGDVVCRSILCDGQASPSSVSRSYAHQGNSALRSTTRQNLHFAVSAKVGMRTKVERLALPR